MNSPSTKPKSLLSTIQSPEDLKRMDAADMPQLAQEIRDYLIKTLSLTGGHLAPNLGLVEVSLAMHRVFDTPRDKFLFDVSHQSYIHKMMTGRRDDMLKIRQYKGISGFTKRSESEHDAFGAGHAGTALSAGLGMAAARDLKGDAFHVISLVGDGAFTCGPSLEALNNIATTTKKFIIILNDNEWSIDKNVGSLSRYFSSLQETTTYTWLRDQAKTLIDKMGGGGARDQAVKLLNAARTLTTPLAYFHQLGLYYYGPINGHDTARLERVMRIAARRDTPVVIHVITEKGRGYAPASNNPKKFHGVGAYNVHDGSTAVSSKLSYSEVFGRCLTTMAEDDPTITAITAAMPSGTKLDYFRENFPKRFYDVGIAEEHAAIFSCGLATEGLKPYLAIYSTFMQRCVDMIAHDAALQNLPVRFCMDRAGLSPDDGPTHHGLFDISMLRCIPNLVMMQPKDEVEFCHMLATMNLIQDKPSAIRYPRGEGLGLTLPTELKPIPIGTAEVISEGHDIALFALGNMNEVATELKAMLEQVGLSVAHINARFIKPLDEQCILKQADKCRLLVSMEDHSITGGFGSAVLELLNAHMKYKPLLIMGWPDEFVEHGTFEILRELHGMTAKSMFDSIITAYKALKD